MANRCKLFSLSCHLLMQQIHIGSVLKDLIQFHGFLWFKFDFRYCRRNCFCNHLSWAFIIFSRERRCAVSKIWKLDCRLYVLFRMEINILINDCFSLLRSPCFPCRIIFEASPLAPLNQNEKFFSDMVIINTSGDNVFPHIFEKWSCASKV